MSEQGLATETLKNKFLRKHQYEKERDFFRDNTNVAGMMTKDDKVIINPTSMLFDDEKDAVFRNEVARLAMNGEEPSFSLTEEQKKGLAGSYYENASDGDRKATIAARIFSGDPSAGKPTKEQSRYVEKELPKLIDNIHGR